MFSEDIYCSCIKYLFPLSIHCKTVRKKAKRIHNVKNRQVCWKAQNINAHGCYLVGVQAWSGRSAAAICTHIKKLTIHKLSGPCQNFSEGVRKQYALKTTIQKLHMI